MLKLVPSFKSLVLTGIVLGGLFTVPSATTPPQNAPLSVPDVMFYGTATMHGEVLESGTIKAVLPRGERVVAEIAPIQGTDYNYALAVPLNTFDDPETAELPAGAVVAGDTLRFTLNGTNAYYQDANGLDVQAFTVPGGVMGETYVLDLMIGSEDDYMMGDVNVNGYRDVADALLMLRYSVGFVAGDEEFPPAPGNPYLPLCDIVVDGLCNVGDAQRTLQCDVGLPDVPCLPSTLPSITQTPGASLVFGLQVAPAPGDAITRTVQVRASDSEQSLGAASLELHYDPTQLTVSGCITDPLATLDAGECYAAPDAGSARLNGVAIDGTDASAVLAELTFAPVGDHSVETLAGEIDLQVNGAFDQGGEVLAWTYYWADVNRDWAVDVADVQEVADHWRCTSDDPCYHARYDVNDDDVIDVVDIMLVAGRWGW